MQNARARLVAPFFIARGHAVQDPRVGAGGDPHRRRCEVLLIERADQPGFWQSVTGSQGPRRTSRCAETAVREVAEETGIVVGSPRGAARGSCATGSCATSTRSTRVWRHRYAPGVTHNTEHVFGLPVPRGTPVALSPREHLRLPLAALARGGRPLLLAVSNAEAILQLPQLPADATPRRSHSTLQPRATCCAWPPTTSTRACAASGRASGWRSTTWAWASRRSTPTWCSCRRCAASTTREARRFARTSFGWPRDAAGRLPGARRLRGGLPHQRRHAPRRARQCAAVALAAGRHRPPRRVATTASSSAACCTCRCTGTAAACTPSWRTSG